MPKQCFVVMGFGIKTDYATGRKLDLNKSYRLLIKPVVEEKGLVCIRADEIIQTGTIDVPMYQQLFKADIVIADLSTANVNAFYELGLRHALRPYSTVVISEDKLTYPFDLNHIKITSYTHLGDAIDYEEVERFRSELGKTIDAVLANQQPDSPVYTYLSGLIPPSLQDKIDKAVATSTSIPNPVPANEEGTNKTLSAIIEQAEQALEDNQLLVAKTLFNSALVIAKTDKDRFNDSYLIHRLAYVSYKYQQPDEIATLNEALNLLVPLDLDHTNDPQTVALAGAIEKRLYQEGAGDEHLESSILYYQRGYYLLNNRYNGINLAYTLNCRAASSLATTKEEQMADMIYANRARRRVLYLAEKDWEEISQRELRDALKETPFNEEGLASQQQFNDVQKFWILLNKAESYFGLGEFDKYKDALAQAEATPHKEWRLNAFKDQLERLRALMEKMGHLLNPPWQQTD